MRKKVIKNITDSIAVVGLLSCAMVGANTSVHVQPFNNGSIYYSFDSKGFGTESMNMITYSKGENNFKFEIEAQDIFGKMRFATQDEQDNVQTYIDKISRPTGVDFWK